MATVTAFKSSSILSISEVNDDSQVDIVYHTNPDKIYTYHVNDIEAWETELSDTIEEEESVGAFVNRARRSELIVEVN
jgi:MOSC domain-containing protein YiiM